ncbi:hypothetical protein D3C87_1902710 [compost metagenome]
MGLVPAEVITRTDIDGADDDGLRGLGGKAPERQGGSGKTGRTCLHEVTSGNSMMMHDRAPF